MSAPSSLYETFDRVVCINLDRRPDRWNAFRARLSAIHWPFRTVERFRAIDGKQVKAPAWFKGGNGAWGCLQSHLRLLEDALQNGTRSLLILEDDAMFPVDFGERVEQFLKKVPNGWDGLMLGGQHLARPYHVSDGVVRVANGNRTHAHVLRGRYLLAAYRHLCDYPTHIRVPNHHVDHRLGSLHISGKNAVYAPNPWLVGQTEGASDISGKQEKLRYWKDDRRPRIDPILPTTNAKTHHKQLPLVAVVGLYCSGTQFVAQMLQQIGISIGTNVTKYFEDEELRELLCNFFGEPELVELVAPPQREKLLRAWLSRRHAAAASSASYIAATHPLLPLVGKELANICRDQLRVIYVDRDFEEAVTALATMPWPGFKKRAHDAQSHLQRHLEHFLGQRPHLRIAYGDLQQNPSGCLDRITEYLPLDQARAPGDPATHAES